MSFLDAFDLPGGKTDPICRPPSDYHRGPIYSPPLITFECELRSFHPPHLLGVDAMADTNPRQRTPLRYRPKRGDLGTITEGKETPVPVRVTKDVPEDGDSVLVVPAKVESDDSPREVKLDEFTPKNAQAVAGLLGALVGDVGVRARAKGRTSELTASGLEEDWAERDRERRARLRRSPGPSRVSLLRIAAGVKIDKPRSITEIAQSIAKAVGPAMTPQPAAESEWREFIGAESEWREFIGQDFEAMGITAHIGREGRRIVLAVGDEYGLVLERESWLRHGADALAFVEEHRITARIGVDDDGTREVVDKVESWHWEDRGTYSGPWVLHVAYRGGGGAALFITAKSDPWRYYHGPDIVRETRYSIAAAVAEKAGLWSLATRKAARDFVNGVFQ